MTDFSLSVKDSNERIHTITTDTLPDTCPCCHKGIQPTYKLGFRQDNSYPTVTNVYVQTIFQCPRRECHRFFIADYLLWNEGPRHPATYNLKYELRNLSPYWYEKRIFPEPIEKISPSFCNIFNQSAHAEALKLLKVAGPGYRKALEFLVKDFLVTEEPDKADSIKKPNYKI